MYIMLILLELMGLNGHDVKELVMVINNGLLELKGGELVYLIIIIGVRGWWEMTGRLLVEIGVDWY